MMKWKTLALIAAATCCVGNLLLPPISAQEATVPQPSPQEAIGPQPLPQEANAPPAAPATAPPANTGVLANWLARATPEAAGADQRFWFKTEYLFAFMRGTNVPPLVTTSPSGTSATVAGTIGGPGTRTLFGNDSMDGELRSGVRIGTGYWFGGDSPFGVEGDLTVLESQASVFSASSAQFPILARPFINAANGTQQAILVAFPGASTGSISARIASGNFYSGGFDVTEKALDEGWFKLIGMIGYRFYRYGENASITQSLTETNPAAGAGTQAVTNDGFGTNNTFNGFDMGFRAQFVWDQFSLDLLTRVAVGDLQRRITINGIQAVTVPGAPTIYQTGGVLALVSNSGSFDSHDWKAAPEFGLNLNWQIRPYVKLSAGYSFLLLSGVARAVDQIDTTINQNFLPPANLAAGGPIRPFFTVQRSDMWIQSFNLGIEFTY
jgi:hypothetical protein